MTTRRALIALTGLLAAALAAPWPALGEEGVIKITRADCQQLVEHAPAPDVAYQPGVDVYGRPVAPADLNGGTPLAVPEVIEIPIEVKLQDRFGFPANPSNYKADAFIGWVEVDMRDGRATFNGQPLQDEDQAELTRRCQEILYGKP